MYKNVILLFWFVAAVLFSNSINAQGLFRPLDFSFKELAEEHRLADASTDPIIIYLHRNYDSLSPKYDLKRDEYEDNSICSYSQDFSQGIRVIVNDCGEGGGSVEVSFPKAEAESIKLWIEKIYKSTGTEIENKWNAEGDKYQPIDEDVGCYYEIIEKWSSTVVDSYCGC